MQRIGRGVSTTALFQVTEKLLAAEEQKLRLLKSDIDELRNGGDVTTSLSKVSFAAECSTVLQFDVTGQRAGSS